MSWVSAGEPANENDVAGARLADADADADAEGAESAALPRACRFPAA